MMMIEVMEKLKIDFAQGTNIKFRATNTKPNGDHLSLKSGQKMNDYLQKLISQQNRLFFRTLDT